MTTQIIYNVKKNAAQDHNENKGKLSLLIVLACCADGKFPHFQAWSTVYR